jgi:hypothetical protein
MRFVEPPVMDLKKDVLGIMISTLLVSYSS